MSNCGRFKVRDAVGYSDHWWGVEPVFPTKSHSCIAESLGILDVAAMEYIIGLYPLRMTDAAVRVELSSSSIFFFQVICGRLMNIRMSTKVATVSRSVCSVLVAAIESIGKGVPLDGKESLGARSIEEYHWKQNKDQQNRYRQHEIWAVC